MTPDTQLAVMMAHVLGPFCHLCPSKGAGQGKDWVTEVVEENSKEREKVDGSEAGRD